MNFLKRLCVYLCIFLLCISIYKDITEGTSTNQDSKEKRIKVSENINTSIVKTKIKPGDTVLSITEQLNNFSNNPIDIPQILADFKQYNPNTNPSHLHVNEYYYFLKYDDK